MSDEAIDVAVVNLLKNDATLQALAPGGVFRDVAPEAVVRAARNDPGQVFGIVTLQAAPDSYAFEGAALEEPRYLVKFVSPSSSPVGAQAAATRAQVLLKTLTVSGVAVTASRREERISYVEADGPILWQHRGFLWFIAGSEST